MVVILGFSTFDIPKNEPGLIAFDGFSFILGASPGTQVWYQPINIASQGVEEQVLKTNSQVQTHFQWEETAAQV